MWIQEVFLGDLKINFRHIILRLVPLTACQLGLAVLLKTLLVLARRSMAGSVAEAALLSGELGKM